MNKYFALCKYTLLRLGILISQEDHPLVEMDKMFERAFHIDANAVERANAALILPAFESELKNGRHAVEVLDWVDLDTKNNNELYRKLQKIKRRIDLK